MEVVHAGKMAVTLYQWSKYMTPRAFNLILQESKKNKRHVTRKFVKKILNEITYTNTMFQPFSSE